MRQLVAEALGTFAMVFAGCGSMVIDHVTGGGVTHVGIAMTFGLVVMAMIYALGDVSGAHFNPAVSVGFFLARRLSLARLCGFAISQVVGALAACGMLRLLFGNVASLGATIPAGSDAQSFGLEVILTATLMFVILSVALGSKEMGIMAGAAIGGVIALEALFAGPISGASMNPARSLAPALVSGDLRSLWVYMLGPLLGSAIAVPLWHVTSKTKPTVILLPPH